MSEELIIPKNPFLFIDFLSPVYKQEFDKEELKYIEVPTDEYIDEVFVFDVKEVRIKYFCNHKIKIKTGKKTETIDTTLITFTDDTELLTRATIKELFEDFLTDYLLKIKTYYPEDEN
jgi:hypothetical protein